MKRALLAGGLGTLAVAALGPVEKQILGREPRFAPEALAKGLARAHLDRSLSQPAARAAGIAMRAAYGPAWGLALTMFPRAIIRRPLAAGGLLGVLVDAFEEHAFPLTRATRAPERWPRLERRLLRAQTIVFGLVTAVAYSRLTRAWRS